MWSTYGGRPQVRFVRVGTLDEPSALSPDVHIYTRSKLPWVEVAKERAGVRSLLRCEGAVAGRKSCAACSGVRQRIVLRSREGLGMPPRSEATKARSRKSARKQAKPATRKRAVRARSRLTPAEIELLFSRLEAKNPNPKGELDFVNPYTLLVAVVLSAQATDVGVNKATKPLFAHVDTPRENARIRPDASSSRRSARSASST